MESSFALWHINLTKCKFNSVKHRKSTNENKKYLANFTSQNLTSFDSNKAKLFLYNKPFTSK